MEPWHLSAPLPMISRGFLGSGVDPTSVVRLRCNWIAYRVTRGHVNLALLLLFLENI